MKRSECLEISQNLRPGQCEEFEFDEYSVRHECLAEGRAAGVHQLTLNHAGMSATWLLTRGLSLANVEVNAQKFGWNSPIRGPVHPQWVPINEPSGLGWLDGFDELMVRCGLTSNGAPEFDEHHRLKFPLHGRIGNLPAQSVTLSKCERTSQVVLSGHVWETRFHFQKWQLHTEYRLDFVQRRIRISDRVANFSGIPRDFQMLYHYNLGEPLLSPGSRIACPMAVVSPRDWHSAPWMNQWNQVSRLKAGEPEQVFFCEPLGDERGNSLAVLTNVDQSAAAGIEFSVTTLPCFSLWKNLSASADGFVVGLEPATNFPNIRSFESQHHRTVWLDPETSWDTELGLLFADNRSDTAQMLERVERIQNGRVTQLIPEPNPRWSAARA